MSPLELAVAVIVAGAIPFLVIFLRLLHLLTLPFAPGCNLYNFQDDTGREADGDTDYSIQTASLTLPPDMLERLWNEEVSVELGRAYWRQMKALSLGLLRIEETEERIRVRFLLFPPLLIFQFSKPEYKFSAEKASVTWHIQRGLMVNRAGRYRGTISVSVKPEPSPEPEQAKLTLEMALRDFRPLFWSGHRHCVYRHTQSRYHVILVYSFFRRLAAVGPLK